MGHKKYKLLSWEQSYIRNLNQTEIPVKIRRIQALIDIPEHNVKAGDIGGFVSSKTNLSHEGTCWIADDAIVYKYATVTENALISGHATIMNRFKRSFLNIRGNVKITDEAEVAIMGKDFKRDVNVMSIDGRTRIMDNAKLYNVREINGDVLIANYATIMDTWKIIGKTTIKDGAELHNKVIIVDSEISGNAIIMEGSIINNSKVTMGAVVPEECTIFDSTIDKNVELQEAQWVRKDNYEETTPDKEKVFAPMSPSLTKEEVDIKNLMEMFTILKSDIAEYETDIAKIIQYPVMVDKTDPYTAKMFMALKRATMLSVSPDERFSEALQELGESFLAAESNALRIQTTLLSDDAVKKTIKAKDLLNMAANEASTEHEKATSFVQGFKALEGVLPVPSIAKDTFRAKIGLKEIEVGV